jgi:hypothetical protein
MELLLNLAWSLLALPAYWLWRSSRTAPAGCRFTSFQCLLALGCLLVILFPVISATDDLLAVRSEMEESPAGKRTLRQASHEKASGWKLPNPPALAATTTSFLLRHAEGRHTPPTPYLLTLATPVIPGPGRAPPLSLQA